MSNYAQDKIRLDPDSDFQDSAAALLDEPARVQRPRIDTGSHEGRDYDEDCSGRAVEAAFVSAAIVLLICTALLLIAP